MQRDLHGDSVVAPGATDSRWLLYASQHLEVDGNTGTIQCFLCRKCEAGFARKVQSSGAPAVRMHAEARANGLWRGPEPAELSQLTYCECKVINMARIYVSVKRVFLDLRSYARTTASEAPLYHQKNAVAYPQNPEAALLSVGMWPADLAEMLTVQFVGGSREQLRHEPSLSVSVVRLRAAFHWLAFNCWPFMEATRHHAVMESGALGESLEAFLAAFEKSVGGSQGGTPSEIVQGASKIDQGHAAILQKGPGDATAKGEGEDNADASDDEGDVGTAAALDGGVDEITPLQLWDAIMRKYKVMQTCEAEIAKLGAVEEKSERLRLEQERAIAIAAAVEAIGKLQSSEVRRKL
jgi:hypothetical protein